MANFLKKIGPGVYKFKQAVQKTANSLEDMRLNRSGTVGTEPILQRDRNGNLRKYIEVKAGPFGKFDIPTRDVRKAEDSFPKFKLRPQYKKPYGNVRKA